MSAGALARSAWPARIACRGAWLAWLAGLALAAPAGATDAVSPARALMARGPLALSFAAGPGAGRWAIETGWPLGQAPRGSAPADAAHGRGTFDARLLAIDDRDLAGTSRSSYGLVIDRASGPGAGWLGVATGGDGGGGAPRPRLRLAAGLERAFASVQGDVAVISSAMLFHGDPRWTRTTHWSYVPGGVDTVARDTSTTFPTEHTAQWTTTQVSLRWQRGRVAFETVGGLTIGEAVMARRWAQGTARLQLSRHVLALVSVGERPAASLAFDGTAHPHTMLGLQYAPWSTREWAMVHALRPVAVDWRTSDLHGGRTLVRVHCRETHRVEIAGDFTDWQAVELLPVHGGWWAGALPIEPGLHRVQVRLDGGPWLVPPGLPRADDGPAGESGSLLVR